MRLIISTVYYVVLVLLLLSCIFPSKAVAKPFTHLTYAQIHYLLTQLAQEHPNLLRIYSAQDRFSLPHVGNCSELVDHTESVGRSVPCTIWVAELSNFDTLPKEPTRPEWIVSGTLHGDEVVGPITVLAFIEYMVTNYDKDPFASRMLDTRLTTLVPMTNAVGFFRNERTELQESTDGSPALHIDPNRDFGYDQAPENCMQTVAARALNELFRVHLFRVAITFHGGTNALGYEWGDMTHCDGPKCVPAPDLQIMHALAERMSAHAGPAGSFENAYPIGDMGKLVYPVHGGLEDWGYGASWTDLAVVCTPTTLGEYPPVKTAIDRKTKRVVTYLVEMSHDKRPAEHTLGDSNNLTVKGADGDGHVPRNVRLLMSAIDAVEPYIVLNDLESVADDGRPEAVWSVGGAFLIDATIVQWSTMNGTHFGTTKVVDGVAGLAEAGGVGNRITEAIPGEFPTANVPVFYRIAVIVDQDYAKPPPDAVPDVDPQSHLMGARASSAWDFNVGDRQIRGSRIFFSDTVAVRKSADGKFSQSVVKDIVWSEHVKQGLYSQGEAALCELMLSPSDGGIELVPKSMGASGLNLVIIIIISIVGVMSIVAVGVGIYIVIRQRRGKRDRASISHLPFSVGEDSDTEQIALASDSS